MLAGEGELRSAEVIIVGKFAFADTATGLVHAAHAAGRRVGFVHRNNQAVVPLGSSFSMAVPAGRETALFTSGDFYTVFTTDVVAGDPVYALDADGTPVNVATTAQATPYKVAKSATAGELAKITVQG